MVEGGSDHEAQGLSAFRLPPPPLGRLDSETLRPPRSCCMSFVPLLSIQSILILIFPRTHRPHPNARLCLRTALDHQPHPRARRPYRSPRATQHRPLQQVLSLFANRDAALPPSSFKGSVMLISACALITPNQDECERSRPQQSSKAGSSTSPRSSRLLPASAEVLSRRHRSR